MHAFFPSFVLYIPFTHIASFLMTESSLLHSPSSDDDMTMDALSTKRQGKRRANLLSATQRTHFLPQHGYQQLQQQLSDSDEGDFDLEAPASLLIERQPSLSPQLRYEPSSRRRPMWQQQQEQEQEEPHRTAHVSTFDRTMWRWTNVENMDDFFQKVYNYYQGKGLYCILLARLLNLLVLAFLIFFSTFLVGCVNYSDIPTHHSLSEVLVPHCYSR